MNKRNALDRMNQNRAAIMASVVVTVLLVMGAATYQLWLPHLRAFVTASQESEEDHTDSDGEQDHEGHDHGVVHAGHSDDTAIELTGAGLKNIDYTPVQVSLSTFQRTIALPAMVVERPGHSQIQITAPLTGVVTKVYAVQGAASVPGSPMFDIRLTHEELVAAQRSFLQTAENLKVVKREIDRLNAISEDVLEGKRVLEQEYERQKFEASLRAERQALLLHGLKDDQLDQILATGKLVPSLTVYAPAHTHEDGGCQEEHLFHVQRLTVSQGQHVDVGELLCVIADHCELYIEGRAFEDDAMRLREAARAGSSISASVVVGRRQTDVIEDLKLLYLADQVDQTTRAFRFYLRLPNQVALDRHAKNDRRFIAWRFNPGQRMELRVPVETWDERIVLPVESIVEEGVETYVYERNGDHFDRLAVHVQYRDQTSAVIANDGALKLGKIVAAKGAYQMHLALKNRTTGGVDPHAGHTH
ncbi:MAG: efflux RND transporter periplasmic adaptor subunit [Pirellulaceae bacterium]|nr:efflux RND transporter periplasmic adaptor subunit [Pirellulaceae bacterium]HJN09150.1 efflux RND transporter periplasmic adaptor subunit [Pirellulaceae bacterium]